MLVLTERPHPSPGRNGCMGVYHSETRARFERCIELLASPLPPTAPLKLCPCGRLYPGFLEGGDHAHYCKRGHGGLARPLGGCVPGTA